MPAYINTAEGGTDGVTVTTANSGGGSGDAWDTVAISTGGALTFSNFAPAHGSRGYAFGLPADGTSGAHRLLKNAVEAGRFVVSVYFQYDLAITATEDVCGVRHSAGNMAILVVGSDGKLIVQNAAGSGISASRMTTALAADKRYRVDFAVTKGTTTANGRFEYSVWDVVASDATAVFSYDSGATQNTGTADVAAYFVGRSTGRTQANTLYADTIRGSSLASGFHAAYVVTNVAPTCDLGPDVGGIEPWATQSIDASASSDSDGTLAAYEVSQTAGPAVTITGAGPQWTYMAPAVWGGTSVTFQARVQDNGGTWSAYDAVTHTVMSPTEAICGTPPTPIRLQVF